MVVYDGRQWLINGDILNVEHKVKEWLVANGLKIEMSSLQQLTMWLRIHSMHAWWWMNIVDKGGLLCLVNDW